MKYTSLLFIVVLLYSCKSDKNAADSREEDMTAEEIYFEDYEKPFNAWGYIDTLGKLVIDDQYDAARPFRNGLAIVNYAGKWGMIDKNNQMKVPFEYRSLFHFSDGLARFQDFDQKYGYINQNGEEIIPAVYEKADDFSNGLAKVSINGFDQFINREGELAFEKAFTKASNFELGFAKVKPFEGYGTIDTLGQTVIPFENDMVYALSESLVRVRKDKKYGFYKEGKLVIDVIYDKATDFHNGIAAARLGRDWFFIDENGKQLRSIPYQTVDYGNEGFWMVSEGGKFGMIDREGKTIIPCNYTLLYKFKEGKCAYSENGFWGFYDTFGNKLTEAIFGLVWDYNNGYARALSREGLMILDSEANVVFSAPSTEMRDFDDGLAPIQIMN